MAVEKLHGGAPYIAKMNRQQHRGYAVRLNDGSARHEQGLIRQERDLRALDLAGHACTCRVGTVSGANDSTKEFIPREVRLWEQHLCGQVDLHIISARRTQKALHSRSGGALVLSRTDWHLPDREPQRRLLATSHSPCRSPRAPLSRGAAHVPEAEPDTKS